MLAVARNTKPIVDNRKYGQLVAKTAPGLIETEEENERALEIVNSLINKGEDNLTLEENRFFRLLVRLIEDFEERTYPMGEARSPKETLTFFMEEHSLKQKDLMDVFGSSGTISEVLSGKRAISKLQAKKLSDRFKVSVELFI